MNWDNCFKSERITGGNTLEKVFGDKLKNKISQLKRVGENGPAEGTEWAKNLRQGRRVSIPCEA